MVNAVTQLANKAQGLQRFWSAVNEVAGKPQPVVGRIEVNQFKQCLQLVEAALDITYGINRHASAGG
jgi:hypothetical protein